MTGVARPDGRRRPARVAVVGGGVTGLAAAHRLVRDAASRQLDLDVLVLEESSRSGGVLATEVLEGVVLERGPDCFISTKPAAFKLCQELGLEDEVIGTNPDQRRSFILARSRLVPVPDGLYLLAPTRFWPFVTSPLVSWHGKLRMALDLVIPPRRSDGDESLADFVTRRLGREALERIAQPMVGGIFAADPRHLSVRATFPQFLDLEARYGSILRGFLAARGDQPDRGTEAMRRASGPRYGLFLSLRDGLGSLVDRLARAVGPERIRRHARVARIAPAGGASPRSGFHDSEGTGRAGATSRGGGPTGWTVELESGETIRADAVCVAVPARSAARLLPAGLAPLRRRMETVPYGPSATLNLIFDRDRVRHPLDGMGFVVPSVEGRSFLGCSFSSTKFPGRAPAGRILLRAFIAGPTSRACLALPDDALVETVLNDLVPILGIAGRPTATLLTRHAIGLPQYAPGHLDHVEALEGLVDAVPGLALAGNGYRGVGIPDCIESAHRAAAKILGDLEPEAVAARDRDLAPAILSRRSPAGEPAGSTIR